MAKGYIIEEIRASVRLRDPESGKSIEVPLKTGGPWAPSIARGEPAARNEPARREDKARPKTTERPARHDEAPTPKVADATHAAKSETPAEEPAKRRKPRRDRDDRPKANARKSPRTGDAAEKKPDDATSLASIAARTRRVDLQHVSPEDAEAWGKLQADLRHMRGRKGGKKGGLGWEETTDAGRSGLIARSGNGAYKILHAGADTYGLFYEWDNGKYERLACGRAEDLMNLAAEQAQDGPPAAPPTKLSLELARLVCGNAEQKASAAERLEPVFREVDVSPSSEPSTTAIEDTPEPRARRSNKTDHEDIAGPPAMPVDPAMDAQLVESLKKALAELEE